MAPHERPIPTRSRSGILLPLTGTFAAVAETQKEGALLAVDVVNKRGGLNMPWGKVTVEGVVADDEAKQDVGVRRYRYMVSEGVKGRGRADLGAAGLCDQCHRLQGTDALLPGLRHGQGGVQEGQARPLHLRRRPTAPGRSATWPATPPIKTLGKKKIFFLARADSWGWDIRDGVYAAAKENGARDRRLRRGLAGHQRLHDDPAEGQGGQARRLHLRPVRRRRRGAPQAGPPDGPQQGDDHLQRLHHQRGRQGRFRPRRCRASTPCITSTTT